MSATAILFSSWWTLGIVLVAVNATLFGVSVYSATGRLFISAWVGFCALSASIVGSIIVASLGATEKIDTDFAAQIMCLIALLALCWLWLKRRPI